MMAEKITWLKVGPEPHLATCERCGGTVAKPPLPTPVSALVKYVRYAEEAHRYCRPELTREGGA